MARQLNWRKVAHDHVWRTTTHPSTGIECKLEVHAAIRMSSIMNRNARLFVSTADSDGNYTVIYEREFYSAWQVKDFIDSLLVITRFKEDKTNNLDWFVNELRSLTLPTPALEPNKEAWASPSGYPF